MSNVILKIIAFANIEDGSSVDIPDDLYVRSSHLLPEQGLLLVLAEYKGGSSLTKESTQDFRNKCMLLWENAVVRTDTNSVEQLQTSKALMKDYLFKEYGCKFPSKLSLDDLKSFKLELENRIKKGEIRKIT